MTNVIKAALTYRQQLRAELKRVEEFVSYAECLAGDAAQDSRQRLASKTGPSNPPYGLMTGK